MISAGSKTAIIGAGASGLAAAISVARRGSSVTVYDHKDRAGLKISITGNGRCNFTNAVMNAGCYHESENGRVAEYLKKFSTDEAVNFFESIGVRAIEKNGYYYPESEKAEDIVNALVDECKRLGVKFIFNCSNPDINDIRLQYDNVILACGSFAHKETGSNGSGYKFLEALGIKYTRVLPALCAVYCDDDTWCRKNDGRRIIATVTAVIDGEKVACDTGEVQVTSYGYSGIPIFQISRYISRAIDNQQSAAIEIDFNPSPDDVPEIVRDRYEKMSHHLRDKIDTQSDMIIDVSRVASFAKSQVCTGGVPLEALSDGFEVLTHPGVYVIGEMCDVDGICGGYNLHWAWLSGNLCGL